MGKFMFPPFFLTEHFQKGWKVCNNGATTVQTSVNIAPSGGFEIDRNGNVNKLKRYVSLSSRPASLCLPFCISVCVPVCQSPVSLSLSMSFSLHGSFVLLSFLLYPPLPTNNRTASHSKTRQHSKRKLQIKEKRNANRSLKASKHTREANRILFLQNSVNRWGTDCEGFGEHELHASLEVFNMHFRVYWPWRWDRVVCVMNSPVMASSRSSAWNDSSPFLLVSFSSFYSLY